MAKSSKTPDAKEQHGNKGTRSGLAVGSKSEVFHHIHLPRVNKEELDNKSKNSEISKERRALHGPRAFPGSPSTIKESWTLSAVTKPVSRDNERRPAHLSSSRKSINIQIERSRKQLESSSSTGSKMQYLSCRCPISRSSPVDTRCTARCRQSQTKTVPSQIRTTNHLRSHRTLCSIEGKPSLCTRTMNWTHQPNDAHRPRRLRQAPISAEKHCIPAGNLRDVILFVAQSRINTRHPNKWPGLVLNVAACREGDGGESGSVAALRPGL
ncbi:hypothetical protein NCU08546 [Neurospora crassa OR74A]|uniref:Uncharacterized protein n=1 Tax=Neurospora crassa (strain ATCC 24698 / 74-OR23-1A / CBS 708.71 / DSM 1257 / FGSC 987) TaxID=367110 RepID=Q7SBK4_NEUCR|nr:hypothetical protein NCU08546 [Neurospora crassa OR74A]EAA33792.1 hypothetical protein NCU08546 [Neurospora crassa OR74A]|eukprot:XP_963028.1 hypothetical protein NCU08546 [Neurospora crassa OR74A]